MRLERETREKHKTHHLFTYHMGWGELLGDERRKKTVESSNTCDFPSEKLPALEIPGLCFAAAGQGWL